MRLFTWEGMPEHIEELVLNTRDYGFAIDTYWGKLYNIYLIEEWRAAVVQRAMEEWLVAQETHA